MQNTVIDLERSGMTLNYRQLYLLFSLVNLLLEQYLKFRQLMVHLTVKQIPKKVIEIMDPSSEQDLQKDFVQTQNYSFEKMRFSIIKSILNFIIEFILVYHLIYGRYYSWIIQEAQNYQNSMIDVQSEYWIGLFFITTNQLFSQCIQTFFDLYYHFVLEEKYGFNRYTLILYVSDQIKEILISLVIQMVFLKGFLVVADWGGLQFYIYASYFIIGFIFVLMLIYPNYIMPLFNKFENLDQSDPKERQLDQQITQSSQTIGFPLKQIYKMDGSKRSDHSNAFFFGLFSNKRIVLYDTLISSVENEQTTAIVFHELGHWFHNHQIKRLVFSFTYIFGFLYLFSFVIGDPMYYAQNGVNQYSIIFGIFMFVGLICPINTLVGFLMLYQSRTHEYQADKFVFDRKGRQGSQQLRQGLIQLYRKNMGSFINDPYYAMFTFSHPSIIERVQYLEHLEQKAK